MDRMKPEDMADILTKTRPLAWDQSFWNNVKFTIELLSTKKNNVTGRWSNPGRGGKMIQTENWAQLGFS
jgi:hypothetical protein